MKRFLFALSGLLVLALFVRLRADDGAVPLPAAQEEEQGAVPVAEPGVPGRDEVKARSAAPAAVSEEAPFIPAFFPKAKVVATVTEPADAEGRERVLETVETGMKERYVRVVRTIKTLGGARRVTGEVAMVANQLLLQKPDGVDGEAFAQLLRQAGALEVKELGEAVLATFSSRPEDPRALDGYMSKVREVAGADVTVEPNYIRKLF